MIALALAFGFACAAGALVLCLYRLVRGPTPADRILALDTLTVVAVALVVLYGIRAGDGLQFEAALLFAMTGFVATVAYCKFILRGDVIE